MTEFFIQANSFAAPFVSDTSTRYVEAETAKAALEAYAAAYSHPAGLYAAEAYASADAMHKGEEPLSRWLCNHEIAKREAVGDRKGFSYKGSGPGEFEIDGQKIKVDNPKGGKVVAVA